LKSIGQTADLRASGSSLSPTCTYYLSFLSNIFLALSLFTGSGTLRQVWVGGHLTGG
jgi:hypothetical protein